jgi:hypothetical protein
MSLLDMLYLFSNGKGKIFSGTGKPTLQTWVILVDGQWEDTAEDLQEKDDRSLKQAADIKLSRELKFVLWSSFNEQISHTFEYN